MWPKSMNIAGYSVAPLVRDGVRVCVDPGARGVGQQSVVPRLQSPRQWSHFTICLTK